jgi:hypothetical protein
LSLSVIRIPSRGDVELSRLFVVPKGYDGLGSIRRAKVNGTPSELFRRSLEVIACALLIFKITATIRVADTKNFASV